MIHSAELGCTKFRSICHSRHLFFLLTLKCVFAFVSFVHLMLIYSEVIVLSHHCDLLHSHDHCALFNIFITHFKFCSYLLLLHFILLWLMTSFVSVVAGGNSGECRDSDAQIMRADCQRAGLSVLDALPVLLKSL